MLCYGYRHALARAAVALRVGVRESLWSRVESQTDARARRVDAPAQPCGEAPLRAAHRSRRARSQASARPWQCLYFLPLPHGHGSLRPTFCSALIGWVGPLARACCALPAPTAAAAITG